MNIEATSSKLTTQRCWADLPFELLAQIAIRLSLIDLLCFRGTCKEWRASSSPEMAQNESYPQTEPWLLLYKKDDTTTKSILCNPIDSKKYKVEVPELGGKHCLASHQGWLLLHKDDGSIYFFSPFSSAKIDLPNFPNLQVSDHVATLSAPPTSEKCVICVVNRRNKSTVDLHFLHRGDENWTKIDFECTVQMLGTIRGGIYFEGEETFYFLDNEKKVLAYSISKADWRIYTIVEASKSKTSKHLPFYYLASYLQESGLKKLAGLEDNVVISTCATVAERYGLPLVIRNETDVTDLGETEKSNRLEGIWIQPRFCQIRPDQKWSL